MLQGSMVPILSSACQCLVHKKVGCSSKDFVAFKIYIQFFLQYLFDINFGKDAEAFFFNSAVTFAFDFIKRSVYYFVEVITHRMFSFHFFIICMD